MNAKLKRRSIEALRKHRPCPFVDPSDCLVTNEDGLANEEGKFQLEWFPVMAGTVQGRIGNMDVGDSGNGELQSLADGRFAGHIDYVTGWVNLGFGGAGVNYRLSYAFNPDALPAQVPDIVMTITSIPIMARVTRLRPGARIRGQRAEGLMLDDANFRLQHDPPG